MRGHGTLPSRQAPGTQKLRIRWSPGVASRGLTEHRLGGDAHEVEAPLKALRAGRAVAALWSCDLPQPERAGLETEKLQEKGALSSTLPGSPCGICVSSCPCNSRT